MDIDVSNIPIRLEFHRFDKEVFLLDTSHLTTEKDFGGNLIKAYPDFFPLFINKLAAIGNFPSDYKNGLHGFIQNKDILKLKRDCDSVYPNLDFFLPALRNGFQHFLYYYPKQTLPEFITFISGFNAAVVNTDSTLAIGLDMFLGSKYPIYRSVQFPKYITRTLKADFIPLTTMKGYAKQVFAEKKGSPRILDEMIYEGKILYFLDAMFPTMADSMKISYTQAQIHWCSENESSIWSSLLERDRLFRGDKNDLDTYFSEGPFTQGLGASSAPRLGEWMGWQIVRKYMQEQGAPHLQGLMEEQDAEKILRLSHYRP